MSDAGGRLFDCAGLRMRSPVALAAAELDPAGASDVEVVWGEPRMTLFVRPSEDVVAELVVDGAPWYTYCRVEDGFIGRYYGVADFAVSPGLDRVTVHPRLAGNGEVIPILLAGSVAAFLLVAAGHCLLHASAVELGGQAVAFVGASGQGKTTMATVLCAAGALMVTDDVLPLEIEGPGDGPGDGPAGGGVVHCRPSASELRLRPGAASLLERFADDVDRRITVDDRHAVAPESSAATLLPLAAVILPRPDQAATAARAERLRPGEATMCLVRNQRIAGWREPTAVARQFSDLARVVAAVPVLEVTVPWGPPFAPDLADRVLEACGLSDLRTRVTAHRGAPHRGPVVPVDSPG